MDKPRKLLQTKLSFLTMPGGDDGNEDTGKGNLLREMLRQVSTQALEVKREQDKINEEREQVRWGEVVCVWGVGETGERSMPRGWDMKATAGCGGGGLAWGDREGKGRGG